MASQNKKTIKRRGLTMREIKIRISVRELMDVKNAYNLYDTKSAIDFLVKQQYPEEEVLWGEGILADPDPVNSDVVLVSLKVRGLREY
jgi:hypothetical protein